MSHWEPGACGDRTCVSHICWTELCFFSVYFSWFAILSCFCELLWAPLRRMVEYQSTTFKKTLTFQGSSLGDPDSVSCCSVLASILTHTPAPIFQEIIKWNPSFCHTSQQTVEKNWKSVLCKKSQKNKAKLVNFIQVMNNTCCCAFSLGLDLLWDGMRDCQISGNLLIECTEMSIKSGAIHKDNVPDFSQPLLHHLAFPHYNTWQGKNLAINIRSLLPLLLWSHMEHLALRIIQSVALVFCLVFILCKWSLGKTYRISWILPLWCIWKAARKSERNELGSAVCITLRFLKEGQDKNVA